MKRDNNHNTFNIEKLSYNEQLNYKKNLIEDLMKNKAKINVKVNDVIGMENPYHYRNKVHVVVTTSKKGNIVSGLYKEGTHKVIPMEKCDIHDEKADEIINSINKILSKQHLTAYNEDKRSGLIRHILVKRGYQTDETMVVIVTSSDIFPGRNNFVKALRNIHPEITTIIQNTNSRKTSIILGDKERVLYGKGYIEDVLCGLRFNISAKSFYQVNPQQTEVLYNTAIDFAEFTGTETLLDAYCGIGTISLIASSKVKEVIGVEVNKDAINDAIKNAKKNHITNAKFYCNDASIFMNEIVRSHKNVDVVFVDPPRIGCDENFINSLIKLSPKKVVYISCDPTSLARDLQILKTNYIISKLQPVDMFPQTTHIESVVLLARK